MRTSAKGGGLLISDSSVHEGFHHTVKHSGLLLYCWGVAVFSSKAIRCQQDFLCMDRELLYGSCFLTLELRGASMFVEFQGSHGDS
jgi:hypothetical protein